MEASLRAVSKLTTYDIVWTSGTSSKVDKVSFSLKIILKNFLIQLRYR